MDGTGGVPLAALVLVGVCVALLQLEAKHFRWEVKPGSDFCVALVAEHAAVSDTSLQPVDNFPSRHQLQFVFRTRSAGGVSRSGLRGRAWHGSPPCVVLR